MQQFKPNVTPAINKTETNYSPSGLREAAINLVLTYYTRAETTMQEKIASLTPRLRSLEIAFDKEKKTIRFIMRLSSDPKNKNIKATTLDIGDPLEDGETPNFEVRERFQLLSQLFRGSSTLMFKAMSYRSYNKIHFGFDATNTVLRLSGKSVDTYRRVIPYYKHLGAPSKP